jgi:hypothetical protein
MWRWLGILVVVGLVFGCADMWKDTADFFDSGFADDDDDDDGDDGGDTGELTLENLDGSWTLDLDDADTTMDEQLSNTVSDNTLLGSWDKDNASESDFLLENFSQVTELTITTASPKHFTFSTASTTIDFTWEFTGTGEIRLTPTGGGTSADIQAQLRDNGDTLTLIDAEDDRAVFTFQNATQTVVSGRFEVNVEEETCTTTMTIDFRTPTTNPNTLTIAETCTVVDANTLQLTEGGDSVNVGATLSNNEDTLTLNFPADDPQNRGPAVAVFTR